MAERRGCLPEMAELRGRHAQKMGALFREFLRLNPTIDPDPDKDAGAD